MLTTAPIPATAAGLLDRVAEFRPAVEGGALVFDLDPPPDLLPVLRVLHTGIRAAMSGRKWYGCGTDSRTAAAKLLNQRDPIPLGVWLLAVEGDQRWDRIHPAARLDHPGLFDPLPAAGPSRAGPNSRPHPERSG